MAAIPLPNLEVTETLMLCAAELLENTRDPLDSDDIYTVRAEAITDHMKYVGEEISAALNCTSVRRADKLAQALADAHNYMEWACACLEIEYDEWRRVPRKPCLLWQACRVLRVLEQARDLTRA